MKPLTKKPLLYISATITLIASVGLTAIISGLTTTQPTSAITVLEPSTDLATEAATESFSKSESVYAIVNPDGTINKSFVGSNINTNPEPLPLTEEIVYSLDGTPISASNLIGKSGHVKITFKFTATKSYQDKLIPFLTVTGLDLDKSKFTNITIDHGKIISDQDSILLAGYAFAGLSEDLATDILSNSFTITADVTNFELKDTYTFATNEIFAELDTSKLTTIDDVVNSINSLGTAFDQILAGSNDLSNGLSQALAGGQTLQSGAHELSAGAAKVNSGAHELSAGAAKLSDGLDQLVTFNDNIINQIDTTTTDITTIIQELITTYHINPNSPLIKRINTSITKYYDTAYSAVTTYTGNIELLANGAKELNTGASQLATGTSQLAAGSAELASGTDALIAGLSQLDTGSRTLSSGLSAFKDRGINRLVDFANHDLATFTNNLRSTVNAAKSYHHYANPKAESVKFIFKSPSLH